MNRQMNAVVNTEVTVGGINIIWLVDTEVLVANFGSNIVDKYIVDIVLIVNMVVTTVGKYESVYI